MDFSKLIKYLPVLQHVCFQGLKRGRIKASTAATHTNTACKWANKLHVTVLGIKNVACSNCN